MSYAEDGHPTNEMLGFKRITPVSERPPTPPDNLLPPNYQWVWVEERVDGRGKKNKAHWRKWPIKMGKGNKMKNPVGRPPKAVRPQFTGRDHAVYVYERLAIPLAYFAALSDMGFGPKHEAHQACIKAIDDARTFVDRFTGGNDDEHKHA